MRLPIALAAATLVAFLFAPLATATVLVGLVTFLYAATVTYRIVIFRRALRDRPLTTVLDQDARAIPDDELPVYTVLVPVYQEAATLAQLITALESLEYPADRLDVKVLLEADDAETIAALAEMNAPEWIEPVIVPVAEPRTKPKACNYGLLGARGELVTIYDAEDVPEPLQLRRAVAAFRTLGPEVGCLQAKLGFYNENQNLLTRYFSLDYALWFDLLLPGLVAGSAPIPLGGTSNHFRREDLESIGAWDPFNVTEDADLGIRLQRLGRRVAVLDSTTYEEATSDVVNWVKQRSRWYKGYLQTMLVHLRDPRQLRQDLGTRGALALTLFVGGTPVLAALNPVMWFLTALWFGARADWVATLFPPVIFYPALLICLIGNIACVYQSVLAARLTGRPSLVITAFFMPFYWVLMSIAAIKAIFQLFTAPAFWEKTTHGMAVRPEIVLDLTEAHARISAQAAAQ